MSYHTLIIVGHLGRDPIMRFTPSGQAVCDFSVATDYQRPSQNDEEPKKETTWFRVTVWGKQAESCNTYLHKGSQVLVEGRITSDENGNPRIWTRSDGTPAASYEVTANVVRFLSGNAGGQAEDTREESVQEPLITG
jgi:single-strand DNA-binding protein